MPKIGPRSLAVYAEAPCTVDYLGTPLALLATDTVVVHGLKSDIPVMTAVAASMIAEGAGAVRMETDQEAADRLIPKLRGWRRTLARLLARLAGLKVRRPRVVVQS